MELKPIVQFLALNLPCNDNRFSENLEVQSLTAISTTATIITVNPHGFVNGSVTTINGAVDYTEVASLTSSDDIATCRTGGDHGLNETFDFRLLQNASVSDNNVASPTVTILDADQSQFNGIFDILSVPNRNLFTYKIDSPDQTATGNIKVQKYDSYRFTGIKIITVIDSNTFTFEVEEGYNGQIGGEITVTSNIRISRTIDLQRAIDSYTAKATDKYWIFVGDSTTLGSKDRSVKSDATSYGFNGQEYDLMLIERFSIYVFIPSSNDLSGGISFDDFENAKINILKSILGFKYPSQYASKEGYYVTFVSSEMIAYQKAFCVGDIRLEFIQRITIDDTNKKGFYYPFRDIEGFYLLENEGISLKINLDDNPEEV